MKDIKLSGGIQLIDNSLKVKVEKIEADAKLPFYSRPGDAGLDLTAITKVETSLYTEYGTGLKMSIPEGYAGFLFPRSSCSLKTQMLANSIGLIDSNFRGEVKLRFKNLVSGLGENSYEIGDKIGQIVIMKVPEVVFEEVDDLDETLRGALGYGSSGL